MPLYCIVTIVQHRYARLCWAARELIFILFDYFLTRYHEAAAAAHSIAMTAEVI